MILQLHSTDWETFERKRLQLLESGYKIIRTYTKRKYILFGQKTYFAELELENPGTLKMFFAGKEVGEFTEMTIHTDDKFKGCSHEYGGVDAAKAGKRLAEIVRTLSKESVPSQIKYMEILEQQYVKSEDFERAAETRDRISELKEQAK